VTPPSTHPLPATGHLRGAPASGGKTGAHIVTVNLSGCETFAAALALRSTADRPGAAAGTNRGTGTHRPEEPAAYQYWVVAPELRRTVPVGSGRSKTDWTATRPGPSSTSHVVLACHLDEVYQ
jgi:hypothetical protein